MENNHFFDVIIIGGSYAGLSAAMALGRSLRQVLIVDSGDPCNKQTPHSHNFLTQDGATPQQIKDKATAQVLAYNTVKIYNGLAASGQKTEDGFWITTNSGNRFGAKKLLFATGVRDLFPDIRGLEACWGISVLHCPYCHGYEVKHQPIGVLGNGDGGFDLARLISNWTHNLSLFTNGAAAFTPEQVQQLKAHNIRIYEHEISAIAHQDGNMSHVVFKDGSTHNAAALFTRLGFEQKCSIPASLGCELNDMGYLHVDDLQRTNIAGVFAAGDNTNMFRAVSMAVAAGAKAGAVINRELIMESF